MDLIGQNEHLKVILDHKGQNTPIEVKIGRNKPIEEK